MARARRKQPLQGDVKLAVGYIRVSTEEQSLGPQAQCNALERWCAEHDVTLAETFEDIGISGGVSLDKRPGIRAALDAVAVRRTGVLLVAKRDRLARDTGVAAQIERLAGLAGARVFSADGVGNTDGDGDFLIRGINDLYAASSRSAPRPRSP